MFTKGTTKPKRNRHDENFKDNFGNKEVARDFFRYNLPKKVLLKVNLDTLEEENPHFLSSKHEGEKRVDLLYSLKDKKGKKSSPCST